MGADVRGDLKLLLAELALHSLPLLVLANKQDLPGCMTMGEIAHTLELDALSPRLWQVFPTCATTTDGLAEAFAWLKKACAKAGRVANTKVLPDLTYFPGEYLARTKICVLKQLPQQNSVTGNSGVVEAGTAVVVEEVQIVGQMHYGFIKKPLEGWVFIGAHGCGEHLGQKDFLITLVCVPMEFGTMTVKCHNLAGDELATFSVDESFETVAHFRARLSSKLGRASNCLSVVLPNGSILPAHGPKEVLFEALMLDPGIVDAPSLDNRNADATRSTCLVQ